MPCPASSGSSPQASPTPESAFIPCPSAPFLPGTCDPLAFAWRIYISTKGLRSLNSQARSLILVVPQNIGNMRE